MSDRIKYYLDFEFWETTKESLEESSGLFATIIPISMGMACEDGRDFYIEFNTFDEEFCDNDWLQKHVIPYLLPKDKRVSMEKAREMILHFVGDKPEFWGYFSDYDWVAFCNIFGRMIDLPERFPKYCLDLKQEMVRLGLPRSSIPFSPKRGHHALSDAVWIKQAHEWVTKEERTIKSKERVHEDDGA